MQQCVQKKKKLNIQSKKVFKKKILLIEGLILCNLVTLNADSTSKLDSLLSTKEGRL